MLIGYNTNGFAHHPLQEAIRVLADLGYKSVAITLDHYALSPFDSDLSGQTERVDALLDRLGLSCVIETGARFLLDSRRKHFPTLLEPAEEDRRRRRDFLRRSIEIAGALGSACVSMWSGARPADSEQSDQSLMRLLADECIDLCSLAAVHDVRIGFEPEPGMFIETMEQFARLVELVDSAEFGLTLDVGHVHCLCDGRVEDHIARWRSELVNVHLEDMRRGVHEHLMFGEGEMDIPPILSALAAANYEGGVHVELSRHSHDAVRIAQEALNYLRQHLPD